MRRSLSVHRNRSAAKKKRARRDGDANDVDKGVHPEQVPVIGLGKFTFALVVHALQFDVDEDDKAGNDEC